MLSIIYKMSESKKSLNVSGENPYYGIGFLIWNIVFTLLLNLFFSFSLWPRIFLNPVKRRLSWFSIKVPGRLNPMLWHLACLDFLENLKLGKLVLLTWETHVTWTVFYKHCLWLQSKFTCECSDLTRNEYMLRRQESPLPWKRHECWHCL